MVTSTRLQGFLGQGMTYNSLFFFPRGKKKGTGLSCSGTKHPAATSPLRVARRGCLPFGTGAGGAAVPRRTHQEAAVLYTLLCPSGGLHRGDKAARWVGVPVQVGRKSPGREASGSAGEVPAGTSSPQVHALVPGPSRVGRTPARGTGAQAARLRPGKTAGWEERCGAGGWRTQPIAKPSEASAGHGRQAVTSEGGAAAAAPGHTHRYPLCLPRAPGGDLGWGHPGFGDN